MKSLFGTMAIAAAWVVAAAVGIVADRWWLGIIVSILLTPAAYRASDWMERRAAAKEAVAAIAPDYRLVRH